MPKTPAMNTYVGMAKAIPDSRTPRRFITHEEHDDDRPRQPTLCSRSEGGPRRPRFSTPEEIDTATVST